MGIICKRIALLVNRKRVKIKSKRIRRKKDRKQESSVRIEMLANNCWILPIFFFFLCCLFARRFRFSFYRFPWNIHSISMVWHFNTLYQLSLVISLLGLPFSVNSTSKLEWWYDMFFIYFSRCTIQYTIYILYMIVCMHRKKISTHNFCKVRLNLMPPISFAIESEYMYMFAVPKNSEQKKKKTCAHTQR